MKILETHVEHCPGYVVLSVAIQAAEGSFRVHYDRQNNLSEYAIYRVADDGRVLDEDSARRLFANFAHFYYDSALSAGDQAIQMELERLDGIYTEAEQCLAHITISDSREQPLAVRLQELIQLMRDERIAQIAG